MTKNNQYTIVLKKEGAKIIRGILNGIIPDELLKKEKDLYINLLETNIVSYRCLNDNNYKTYMKQVLISKKEKFMCHSNRKCIYFICTKPKIELIQEKSSFKKLYFKICNDIRIKKYKKSVRNILKLLDFSKGAKITYFDDQKIQVLDKSRNLTLYISDIRDIIFPDFNNPCVVYIGETKNPESRPFNQGHTGMQRVITKEGNTKDFFIYYNYLHIRAVQTEPSIINIIHSNSLIEMLNIEKEARFIQNILIKYFLPEDSVNYKKETGELRHQLYFLKNTYHVNNIHVSIEYEDSDHIIYHSKKRKANKRHNFTISTETGNITPIKQSMESFYQKAINQLYYS